MCVCVRVRVCVEKHFALTIDPLLEYLNQA